MAFISALFLLGINNFSGESRDHKVTFTFKLYDEDNNGFLTEEELVKILRATHMATCVPLWSLNFIWLHGCCHSVHARHVHMHVHTRHAARAPWRPRPAALPAPHSEAHSYPSFLDDGVAGDGFIAGARCSRESKVSTTTIICVC